MMLYWRFAWRELRQRPSRPILTLLSIVIGVAAVVAVTIASGTTHRAFDQIFKTVAGQASLQISTPVGTNFDERIVAKIREVPGVKAVAPMMARSTKLRFANEGEKEKVFTITALGVDPAVDREVHDYEITDGKPLPDVASRKSGVLLEANFAKSQGIKVGDDDQIQFTRSRLRSTDQGDWALSVERYCIWRRRCSDVLAVDWRCRSLA